MASSPDFVQPEKRPEPGRRGLWLWLAVPALTLSLFLQVALADRARLAADPVWRPRILALCDVLRCQVPAWHEPAALHVISREIRPHPSAPGVLLVTATFRNDAAFAQAWPQLQLSLTNLDGDSFGLRRFSPREYLGSDPATPLIGAGQSATITLEIVDPGRRAVAFGFEFR
ncbi:MAG: DUF3426 domain-containing protein [Arenimonas sp.]|nr:DUF3426 domain-containing protein [Arenimonas sp.]